MHLLWGLGFGCDGLKFRVWLVRVHTCAGHWMTFHWIASNSCGVYTFCFFVWGSGLFFGVYCLLCRDADSGFAFRVYSLRSSTSSFCRGSAGQGGCVGYARDWGAGGE